MMNLPPTAMSTRPEHFEDETDASSVSDYDSEWTQISGAASEDGDSDGGPLTAGSDRPLSRADTLDGSIDGEIWEGLVDDVASDYGERRLFTRLDELDATQLDRDSNAQSLSASVIATEDDRVNSALNCSLMGTLRASRIRSAASSLQGSMTESQSKLRLSFPDPLLKPTDDGSDDHDSDSDRAPAEVDSAQDSASDEHHDTFVDSEASHSPADVGIHPTLGISDQHVEEIVPFAEEPPTSPAAPKSSAVCALNLILYGSASSSKWAVAEKILKLALQIDFLLPFEEEGGLRRYVLSTNSEDLGSTSNELTSYAQVVDRTVVEYKMEHTPFIGPTMAIVLLPSSLPSLIPKHDLYLPLISTPALDFGTSIPALSSTFSEQVMRDSAHYAWNRVDVPNDRRIVLDANRPDAILDVTDLQHIDPASLHASFRKALSRTKFSFSNRLRKPEVMRVFSNKWYMFAFMATTLLAVTAGSRMRAENKGEPAVAAPVSNSSMHIITTNSDAPTVSAVNAVSLLGSAKEYALTALQTRAVALMPSKIPSQTSLALTTDSYPGTAPPTSQRISRKAESIRPSQAGPSASSSSSVGSCSCHKKSSWTDKINVALDAYLPKDVMVLPDTKHALKKASSPLSSLLKKQVVLSDAETMGNGKAPGKKPMKEGEIKALSLNAMENALSTIQIVGKALMEVMGQDVKALCEAIDELLRVLDRHLETAKTGLGIVKSQTKSELKYRNARAKENAKNIRRAGERFVKAAGDTLRSGSEEAFKAFERVRGNVKLMRGEAGKSRSARRLRRSARKERGQKKMSEGNEEEIDLKASRADDRKKFREEWVEREGERKRMQSLNREEARAAKRERRLARKNHGQPVRVET